MEQKKKGRFRFRRRLRRPRVNLKKSLFLIPHIFTFGNAFLGFVSVNFARLGNVRFAVYCILLGAVLDMFDGRIARKLGTTSEFGLQIDSLSDLVTFCFAPAFLAYTAQLEYLGMYSTFPHTLQATGLAVTLLFFGAGMARLARFNIIAQQQTVFFIGLPSTIAGSFLALFLLSAHPQGFPGWYKLIPLFVVGSLGLLMISSVPFPAFKQRFFKQLNVWHFVGGATLVTSFVYFQSFTPLFVSYGLYCIYAICDVFKRRSKRKAAALHQ